MGVSLCKDSVLFLVANLSPRKSQVPHRRRLDSHQGQHLYNGRSNNMRISNPPRLSKPVPSHRRRESTGRWSGGCWEDESG